MPRATFIGLYFLGAAAIFMLAIMPVKHAVKDAQSATAPAPKPSRIRASYSVDDKRITEFYNDNGEVCTLVEGRGGSGITISCSEHTVLE